MYIHINIDISIDNDIYIYTNLSYLCIKSDSFFRVPFCSLFY